MTTKRKFRLRSLLAGLTLLAFGFSVFGWYFNRQLGQIHAAERLEQKGIVVVEAAQLIDIQETMQPIPGEGNTRSVIVHRVPVIVDRPEIDLRRLSGLQRLFQLQLAVCVLKAGDKGSGRNLADELDNLPFVDEVWCSPYQVPEEVLLQLQKRHIRIEHFSK